MHNSNTFNSDAVFYLILNIYLFPLSILLIANTWFTNCQHKKAKAYD